MGRQDREDARADLGHLACPLDAQYVRHLLFIAGGAFADIVVKVIDVGGLDADLAIYGGFARRLRRREKPTGNSRSIVLAFL